MNNKEVKKVVVHKYRCFEPLNFAQDIIDHLWLQNKMWNNLVEYEEGNYQEYREIMREDETVSHLEQELGKIDARIIELIEERNQVRIKIRKKKGPETAPYDDEIATLKKEAKELRREAREARKAAKERMKPHLDKLNEERKEAYKQIYQNSGLYWGNYNRVIDSMKVARSQTMKTGGRLKFHRFDGSGIFKVQIQGGCTRQELETRKVSVCSLLAISSDEFNRLIGKKKPSRRQPDSKRSRKRKYALLQFTIYRGKSEDGTPFNRTLDLPVIVHRSLPDDNKNLLLKEATLRRERVAPGQFRWWVTFTFTDVVTKIAEHPYKNDACGINIGWKTVQDGLRIATLVSHQETYHFILPNKILKIYKYLRNLQSKIDLASAENDEWVREVLNREQQENSLPEELIKPFTVLKRSKRPHPDKFAWLVSEWDKVDYLPAELSEARARADYVHRFILEQANLRDKVIGHREDLYRNWAKQIADRYGKIVIDKMNVSQLSKLEKEDGQPNELTDTARQNRVIAAVGLFREWLGKQAAKVDAEVIKASIKSTHVCSYCGKEIKNQAAINWVCPHCNKIFDQDINAARNLLAYANPEQG